MVRFFVSPVAFVVLLLAVPSSLLADDQRCDTHCDELACDGLSLPPTKKTKTIRHRTPVMIGDFYSGSRLGLRGDATIDRLLVFADDLDAPLVLPPVGSTLTLTEPGPVGIFSTSLLSIQQLQTLLINGDPIPGATLMGVVNHAEKQDVLYR